jgi:hypothetical protein
MDSEHPKSLMIAGESGAGKSMSLINMRGQEGVLYLNCEGGKPLPFKNKFKRITVDDPYEIFDLYQKLIDNPGSRFHTVVIDTVSFMMERFEAVHVQGSANTMKAWGDYAAFFKRLMYEYVAKADVYTIMLGHLDAELQEESGQYKYSVPVKGSLKKNGLEAYLTTVVVCKKMKIKDLKPNKLLNISEREEEVGFKHVFQTRTTKQTVGDRIRSPLGLFDDDELYIDNDAQIVIDRLKSYYAE